MSCPFCSFGELWLGDFQDRLKNFSYQSRWVLNVIQFNLTISFCLEGNGDFYEWATQTAKVRWRPEFPKSGKLLKHWLKVFTDSLEMCERIATAQEQDAPDRLRVPFAYVSAELFEIIVRIALRMTKPFPGSRGRISNRQIAILRGRSWRPGKRSQRNPCARLCRHYSF